MSWFKVDDALHSHPKARQAGPAAMGLWTLAGAYCAAYKLDGFVPEDFVSTWPRGRSLAAQLVTAGLWKPTVIGAAKGWQFHDWLDYQPTSDEVESRRQVNRERQRRFRERRQDMGDHPAGTAQQPLDEALDNVRPLRPRKVSTND